MKITCDIFSVIAAMGLVNGMFLAAVFLKIKKGDPVINRFMSFLLICFAIDASWGILCQKQFLLTMPHLLHFWSPVRLLYGPLLFFCTKAMYDEHFKIKRKDGLHLIPFSLSILYILIQYIFRRAFMIQNPYAPFITSSNTLAGYELIAFTVFSQIQLFCYLIQTLLAYRKYGEQRDVYHADLHQKYSPGSFLPYYLGIFSAIIVLDLMIEILMFFGVAYSIAFRIHPVIIPIFIFITGYKLLVQSITSRADVIEESTDDEEQPKYKRIGISLQEAHHYIEKLNTIMEREKLYTDPNITLPMLAKKLSIPRNTLSYIINNYMGLTFYDFINRFRVEEVKELLKDPDHQDNNILEIAYFSGFNSKSSFNSVFKKLTNISPSEYRRKYVTSSSSRGIDYHRPTVDSRMRSVMGYADTR